MRDEPGGAFIIGKTTTDDRHLPDPRQLDHHLVQVLNTLSLWQVGQLRVLGRYNGQLPFARVTILHLRLRLCRGDVTIGDLVVLRTVHVRTSTISAHRSVLVLVAC